MPFCFYFVFFFVLGTIIGSFLNVVIDRIDANESPFLGRSHCFYCHKTLAWWEMVPVLSYFFLKGRCSLCKKKIPRQYPAVEFVSGLIFALLFWRFSKFHFFNLIFSGAFSWEKVLIFFDLILWFYWASVLIAISVYDFKKYLILNQVLLPAIVISFFWKIFLGVVAKFNPSFFLLNSFLRTNFLGDKNYLFGNYSFFISLALGIISFGGTISLISWLTEEKAMGWGDAFLAFFLGIILGWPNSLLALIFSFLIGGVVSFFAIIARKKTMKSYLPFAPFLSIASLTIVLFGDIIIKGYLSILLI